VKEALGLFDKPMQYHDVKREQKTLLAPAHREAARTIARESMVLLKNEGSVLPLQTANIKKLAVIGTLASDAMSMLGSWRAQGRAEDVITILQGFERAAPKGMEVIYSAGADPRSADTSGVAAAVDVAKSADAVVLVIGEHFDLSGEARSRADIELPESQLELARQVLATGKPIVVVLANGRPLAMQWLADTAPAILETWMLGVEAGPAIADVVFGKYSPGGRLPAAFPRTTGTVPFYYGKYPSGRPADPDLSKDTARYMDQPITPLYPFGHGLSYTTFEYSDLQIDRKSIEANEHINISITVRNTGKVAGDEVVQLYLRDPVASVARPVQELRGFKRLALAPGEASRVSFRLSGPQMALFGLDNRWHVEPGRMEVMVGSSSADIRARGEFELTSSLVTQEPAASIATAITVSAIK
jgi:beta-glucosidase